MAKVIISDISQEQRDVLNSIIDNFDALLAKLDADAGVTDADYAATLAIGDDVTRN